MSSNVFEFVVELLGIDPIRRSAIGGTVAFRLCPQTGAYRLFIGPTTKGTQGSFGLFAKHAWNDRYFVRIPFLEGGSAAPVAILVPASH